MQIKDLLNKVSKDQFMVRNLYKEKPFAFTESTPEDRGNGKILTIDFGDGQSRYIELDILLIILQEFYGKEHLIDSIKKFKSYDEVKDTVIMP